MTVRLARLLLACAALGACKREQVRVYLAPKDIPPPAEKTAGNREENAPQRPRPQLSWTLPAGWKEAGADRMSVANFVIGGAGGNATVNITPLPNLEGRESMVIDMWREQVGQPPLGEGEAAALAEVEVAGAKGKLFEIAGTRDGRAQRTIVAIQHTPEASWFYKLAGDEAAVAAQKAAFFDFLKSVRIGGAASAPGPTAEPEPSAEFAAATPEGWRKLAPGQMQVAKFAVPDQGSAKAEVTVSVFPSDTGGTRANVDRWRRQLGLEAATDADLAQSVAPLDPALPDAQLISIQNNERQILGAIVPREGRWWFYKLMGDAEAVTAAREAFVAFAKEKP